MDLSLPLALLLNLIVATSVAWALYAITIHSDLPLHRRMILLRIVQCYLVVSFIKLWVIGLSYASVSFIHIYHIDYETAPQAKTWFLLMLKYVMDIILIVLESITMGLETLLLLLWRIILWELGLITKAIVMARGLYNFLIQTDPTPLYIAVGLIVIGLTILWFYTRPPSIEVRVILLDIHDPHNFNLNRWIHDYLRHHDAQVLYVHQVSVMHRRYYRP